MLRSVAHSSNQTRENTEKKKTQNFFSKGRLCEKFKLQKSRTEIGQELNVTWCLGETGSLWWMGPDVTDVRESVSEVEKLDIIDKSLLLRSFYGGLLESGDQHRAE